MGTRRQFLFAVAAAAGGVPALHWLGRPDPIEHAGATFPVTLPEEDWQARLSPAQYRVLREQGTERPFTSPLLHESRPGVFACAACGHPLFDAAAKFESGTGWPSFTRPRDGAVATSVDRSYFMVRTEVHCARCGSHLGHVFPDGPAPEGLRYCINGVALIFAPAA